MRHREPEHLFTTGTGLSVRVYRLQPEDAQHLVDLFGHLSVTSRYMRFNQYLADVDPQVVLHEAEHLSVLNPDQGLGLLAFADLPDQDNAPVGGARYIRLAEDPLRAEVSVAVRDDVQHQGIGAHLLQLLTLHAQAEGVHALIGNFHTANRRIWALLAESPFLTTTVVDGIQTTVTIDLQTTRQALQEDSAVSSADSSSR